MTTFEGNFTAKNIKIAIVVARFNDFITSKLLGGALDKSLEASHGDGRGHRYRMGTRCI